MRRNDVHNIGGLVIGQTWSGMAADRPLRVVAVDPDLHSVEAEDPAGAVVIDTIEHFTRTHQALHLPLAG